MKQCPNCNVKLMAKSIGPVDVDECEQCGGIWFDKDELREAKDATDSDLHWLNFQIWKHQKDFTAIPSEPKCPNGHKSMVSLKYGHTAVVIDYCPTCRGTWLNKGQFKKIIDSLEDEVVSKDFSGYVKEAVREGVALANGTDSLLSEWKDLVSVLRLMQYRLFVEHPTLLSTVVSVQRMVQ
ncbi:MAG: zf-TFIIB domain-containing protein [bacterium]